MNWFRKPNRNVSENDLIAYHLHELSPGRERAVARALAESAALTAESAALREALHAVQDQPRPLAAADFTRVWEGLRPALRPHRLPVASRPRWPTPALAGTALAGTAAVGVVVFATQHHGAARKAAGPAEASTQASASTENLQQRPEPEQALAAVAGFR